MGLSDGIKRWIRSATPEQLQEKLLEYDAMDERRHSGRDAETLTQLRAAISRELEVRA